MGIPQNKRECKSWSKMHLKTKNQSLNTRKVQPSSEIKAVFDEDDLLDKEPTEVEKILNAGRAVGVVK